MTGQFTAALGTEEQPYTKQVEAEIFGDWAVHGVFNKDDPTDTPSTQHFTVSHVHTGRRLRTSRLPSDLAVSLARALSELGPVPTWEAAIENRETILAFVDAVEIAMGERMEAARIADEQARERLYRLVETAKASKP